MLLIIGCKDAGPVVTVRRRSCGGTSSGFDESRHEQLWTRGADRITNYAAHRILQLNAIMFQSRPRCPVQFDFRFLKDGQRGHEIQLGEGEVALGGESLIARSRAEILLLFGDVE